MEPAHGVQDGQNQFEPTVTTCSPRLSELMSETLPYNLRRHNSSQPPTGSMEDCLHISQQFQQTQPTSNEFCATDPCGSFTANPWSPFGTPMDRGYVPEIVPSSGFDSFDFSTGLHNLGLLNYHDHISPFFNTSTLEYERWITGQSSVDSVINHFQGPSDGANTDYHEPSLPQDHRGALTLSHDIGVPFLGDNIWDEHRTDTADFSERRSEWKALTGSRREPTVGAEVSPKVLDRLYNLSSIGGRALSASDLCSSLPSLPHSHSPYNEAYPGNGPVLRSSVFLPSLQSNVDLSHRDNCTGLPDPPDLFACLKTEPSAPPIEDMRPSNPGLVPQEQKSRGFDDLYTPRWIRGDGQTREGWCSLCKPGKWFRMKTSAYWYHLTFNHGIIAATGSTLEKPVETRRKAETWEGRCGLCKRWFRLSGKGAGVPYFRHVYRHTTRMPKLPTKRRRETHDDGPSEKRPKTLKAEAHARLR